MNLKKQVCYTQRRKTRGFVCWRCFWNMDHVQTKKPQPNALLARRLYTAFKTLEPKRDGGWLEVRIGKEEAVERFYFPHFDHQIDEVFAQACDVVKVNNVNHFVVSWVSCRGRSGGAFGLER